MNLNAFNGTALTKNWLHQKLLLIMKLTTILLFIALVQASAAGYGQKITMRERNADIEKVLKIIKEQSGYHFFYNRDDLPKTTVTVEINQASVEDALKVSLKQVPLNYKIVKNNIFLTRKTPSLLDRVKNIFVIQEIIRGKVVDEEGNPVVGATVGEAGTDNRAVVSEDGNFMLTNVAKNATLLITFIGYQPLEYKLGDKKTGIFIVLTKSVTKLKEVDIILNTGYQNLPKERATGSFEKIDNKLFNRSVGTNVLSRLDGISSSIFFNKLSLPTNFNTRTDFTNVPYDVSIRGKSSLLSSTPLVVVDNFPYDGNVNNINPNDVESITILKDAAAASIWGTRAGNGVIVIKTKTGKFDQPLKVSLNSNASIAQKPNFFYLPIMKSSDFIDIEEFLYKEGAYEDRFQDMWSVFSPVVQILRKRDQNLISPTEAENQINVYRGTDTRSEFMKHLYRKSVNQQYALNIHGGGRQISYLLSGGFDKNLNSMVTSNDSRISLRSNTTIRPIKNLEVQTSILYTETRNNDAGVGMNLNYGNLNNNWPYVRLADDDGNPMQVENMSVYLNRAYRDTVGGGRLLDWHYYPLADLNKSSNTTKIRDILLNIGTSYKINDIISASVKYQYQRNTGQNADLETLESYYTRDKINYYSDWRPATVIRGIPLGDILTITDLNQSSYSGRAQLDLNKTWNDQHQLTAIAGTEVRQNKRLIKNDIVYGYNGDLLTTAPVDFATKHVILAGNDSPSNIPEGYFSDKTDRYTSIFANMAYTFKKRYTISGSARKDATNFFGVKSNQKFQPLWSAGLSWQVSNEGFYHSSILPVLKLRATYGYNGNSVPGQSALPIIAYSNTPNAATQLIFATISKAPNPGLRWESVRNINLGLDFASKGDRLSGSVEYFNKLSTDLISSSQGDPGTGFLTFIRNSGNILGRGVDINLNSINIKSHNFNWTTNLLFSYNRVIVSRYYYSPGLGFNQLVLNSGVNGTRSVTQGKDYYGLYTFKWAGLDPETGDPQGYVGGEISKDYIAITNPKSIDDLDYHGSFIPVYYGALRNTFTYKAFSISANILYKLGYKFRRNAISYFDIYSGRATSGSAEYSDRWQKPGDEKTTNVPSSVYPSNYSRDIFYQHSTAVIENGNHVRLQDVNLSYTFSKPNIYFKNIRLFANASNLGIIWKATKVDTDPDFGSNIPNPRTWSFGLTADF